MENSFKLKQNGTTVKTEIIAGITTFMAMAYILAVNPSILSADGATGLDATAVFAATAIGSAIACLCMAFMANLPFVLSAGMGLNAYLAYTVVLKMGYTWQWALAAVFVEGIIFIILSVTNVREAIFNAIPMSLKSAVSAGIGLFIAFIGFQNAKIIINDDSTLVTMFSWKSEAFKFTETGITVLLAFIGIFVTAFFVHKNIKGGILWGILITWVLGMICQLVGLYTPNVEAGAYSMFPNLKGYGSTVVNNVTAIKATFGGCFQGLSEVFNQKAWLDFIVVLFSFLFVDLFDTLGTIIGCATQANMLDSEGKLPKIKGALLADAIGTTCGAVLGTSTVTTFVESASGIAEGGRTGLTALTAGILFAVSLVLSPIFLAIPSFATAPALVIVGFLMMQSVSNIDWKDALSGVPAFLCVAAMPFAYSIAEGIGWGMISYTILHLIFGKGVSAKSDKLKDGAVHPVLLIVSILYLLKYIFL